MPSPDEIYLRRLRVKKAPALDAAGLAALHEAHVLAVPAHNLHQLQRKMPPRAEEEAVERVAEAKGGPPAALNVAFAWLLARLGFRVRLVEAIAMGGRYAVALVALDDGERACDVGGRLRAPALLADGAEVADVEGSFRVAKAGAWWKLHAEPEKPFLTVMADRTLTPAEALATIPRDPAPLPFVSLATPTGRRRLVGKSIVLVENGKERTLPTMGFELKGILSADFGLFEI